MIDTNSIQFWFYVGLLGLSLDFIGAIGLALESFNLVSNWINRNIIGPYLLKTFNQPAQKAIRQFEDNRYIELGSPGYKNLIKIMQRASTTGKIQPFDPGLVERLELGETQEIKGSTSPIFAILEDGTRKPVDDLGRVKSRRGQLVAKKRELLQDFAKAVPSIVLVAGFGLQIISFYYFNTL